jgi:anti-sigma factor RsiW
MQCTEFHDRLFDVVMGEAIAPEVKAHLTSCQACSAEVASMGSTMDLLDEWRAPEDASPYFMTRLMARVREEKALETGKTASWLSWLRKPAVAVSMAGLLVASIALFQGGNGSEKVSHPPSTTVSAATDLQYLDKNSDVLQNLEMLDDLSDNNGSSTVNP